MTARKKKTKAAKVRKSKKTNRSDKFDIIACKNCVHLRTKVFRSWEELKLWSIKYNFPPPILLKAKHFLNVVNEVRLYWCRNGKVFSFTEVDDIKQCSRFSPAYDDEF